FGETAVGAMAVVTWRQVDVASIGGVNVAIQQAAFADAGGVHAVAHRRHAADDVGALDARKRQRRRAADGKRGHIALVPGWIQPLAGLAIGVVLGCGRDADQYLAGARLWHGHG